MYSIITTLVLRWLDNSNSVLVGLPHSLIHCLQLVQNAATRLIYSIRQSEHITGTLNSLHCLQILEQIVFKTYQALYGTVSSCPTSQFTCVADVTTSRRLRSTSTTML